MKQRLQSPVQPVPPSPLVTEVAAQSSRIVPPEFTCFTGELQRRFGPALQAVLLYGSCLRSRDAYEGVVDLYAVVDDYHDAYGRRGLAWLNAWLPPNVFYVELQAAGQTLRAKYAVISRADFENGVQRWFHSYIWARFAQPVRILYARDEDCRTDLHRLLAAAVARFLRAGVFTLGTCLVDAEAIWTRSLSLAYAAELRPEQDTRARQLTHLNLGDFTRLTRCALPALDDLLQAQAQGYYRCRVSDADYRQAIRHWRLRRWQGRVLSVLRLAKAVFTFNNCVDYAVWKIQRHTGERIPMTPALQRHPLLQGSRLLWQLLRRGVLR